MNPMLNIEIMDREGALMRLIGLIDRRGYDIDTLVKQRADKGQSHVSLQVIPRNAERNIEVLIRQIARLFEVQSVLPADANTAFEHNDQKGAGRVRFNPTSVE